MAKARACRKGTDSFEDCFRLREVSEVTITSTQKRIRRNRA
jgi:hypothetical protein